MTSHHRRKLVKEIRATGLNLLTITLAASGAAYIATAAQPSTAHAAPPGMDAASIDKMVAEWPARPRLAVKEMMGKYGAPKEVSSEAVIWHKAGPYKRIMVTRMEIPHDFPKPHMDFLEHTINFNVPTDKIDDLVAYDASMTINKTAGEMSARCDLEGHNILTLNLARDIIMGKKSVAVARKAFGQNVVEDVMGKHPPYVEKLQFEPPTSGFAFPDKPIIPGSPVRMAEGSGNSAMGGDAEILAFLIAVDDNEILAGAAASKKKISEPVMEFAKMMHTGHGKHIVESMKLGQAIKVVPSDTAAVDALRVKGAGELATLVPLDGKAFESAYASAKVKSHTEVLAMIDGKLLPGVKNAALKKHLTATRESIAGHLEHAKKLQASAR